MMAITYTMTWANGHASDLTGHFILTDDLNRETPVYYDANSITNIKDPVARAVADELQNQAGSATGTVIVSIA